MTTSTSKGIKVYNAALDEGPLGDIILRGSLDAGCLEWLMVDDYQREVLPLGSLADLIAAFLAGRSVPDIELGMRGQHVTEAEGVFVLGDEVYIVDGLQRQSAALIAMQRGAVPRLGAAIHFGTTSVSERARFETLNAHRTKLSSNVLLRNLQHDLEVVQMLLRLTDSPSFVLKGRVCWEQRMKRTDLISAMTFAQVIGRLHSHLGPGRSNRFSDLGQGLEKTMNAVGKNTMRDNIKVFFDLVNECWGINRITYREGAVYMRQSFLMALADVLSGHLDFWRDEHLFVEASLVRKLMQFPVTDPHVASLASASGTARQLLVHLMIEHINSGKRTRRLTSRAHFDETVTVMADDEALSGNGYTEGADVV